MTKTITSSFMRFTAVVLLVAFAAFALPLEAIAGQYRNPYLSGTMPWHRTFRDVNLCTGNLMKTFTDVQVAPARGAGLVLQRTYNSNDDRIGPFGRGWTHAYEIRMEEIDDPEAEVAVSTDFFGGKHEYTRDADGLYTPAAYMHNWLESTYEAVLEVGPGDTSSDVQIDLDGTEKHYIANGDDERVCDYIKDRYGNTTTLEYGTYPGIAEKLLETVTDPSGRTLTFTWTNLTGDPQNPEYRITHVTGPLQEVHYDYYTSPGEPGAGGEAYNLKAVHLDPSGLDRTTEYTYTTCEGETGLLASIAALIDAQEEEYSVVSYDYTVEAILPYPAHVPEDGLNYTDTVWVSRITEPGGVDENQQPRTVSWDVYSSVSYLGPPSVMGHVQHDAEGTENDLCIFVHSDTQLRASTVWASDSYCSDGGVPFCQVELTYDNQNNVETATRPIRGHYIDETYEYPYANVKEHYTYGRNGKVLSRWFDGFPGEQAETHEYYTEDKYFQKWRVTDAEGNVSEFDYYDRYDSPGNRGNMLWAKDARYATTGEKFEYGYSQYGQKIWETDLNNVVTDFDYNDMWGNLTQVVQDPGDPPHLNRTTDMVYDAPGRVRFRTDPSGQTSAVTYNNVGQPTSAYFPATLDTPEETISYDYADNGRLETVSDNRGTTVLGYEYGSDRVGSVSDPDVGTISYAYTERGAVETKSLPGGGEWTYTYPVDIDRVGGFGASQGDPNQYQEDLDEIWYQGSSDPDPALLACGTTTNEDHLGIRRYNLKYENEQLDSYCQIHYCYDGDGDGSEPDSARSHGRLSKVLNTFYYLENSIWESYVLSQNVYTHDDVGNRLTNQVMVRDENGQYQQWTEEYGYDELSRLADVDYGYGSPQTQTYTFDNMGNRLTRNNDTYAYNAANMLERVNSQTQNYFNDENGNTLSGGGRTCVWDSQNRLAECVYNNKTSTFTYGADGLRRSMTVDDGINPPVVTDYVLDGQSVVREIRDEDPVATYLVGPRGVEYRQDESTAERTWYIYDGLGSVLAEVDEDGNVDACRSYDVYGSERWSGGSSETDHAFVGGLGHTTEDATGLIYMRARWYDPAIGRFISEDPGRQGSNWFAYCNGNPVNTVDPDGRMAEEFKQALKLLAGYIAANVLNNIYKLYLHGQVQAACTAMRAVGRAAMMSGKATMELGSIMASEAGFLDPVSGFFAGTAAAAITTSGAMEWAAGFSAFVASYVIQALDWVMNAK